MVMRFICIHSRGTVHLGNLYSQYNYHGICLVKEFQRIMTFDFPNQRPIIIVSACTY